MTNFLSCIIFFWKRYFFFFWAKHRIPFPGTPWTCGRKGRPLPSYCGDCQCIHSLSEETKAINHTGSQALPLAGCAVGSELPWKLGALNEGPYQGPWVREGSSNRQPPGIHQFLEKRSPSVCDSVILHFKQRPSFPHLSLSSKWQRTGSGAPQCGTLSLQLHRCLLWEERNEKCPGHFCQIGCKHSILVGPSPFSRLQERVGTRVIPFFRCHAKELTQCQNCC